MKISKQAYTTEFKEPAVKRIRDGQSVSTVSIDWDGAPDGGLRDMPLDPPAWLAEVLGIPQPDRRTLAEITGLIVRIEG